MARRQRLNPGHIDGRRVLSPLRHPCSPQDDDDEHNDDDDDDDVDDVDDRPASKISESLLAGWWWEEPNTYLPTFQYI